MTHAPGKIPWLFKKSLQRLFALFRKRGYELRVVGGGVRDLFIKRREIFSGHYGDSDPLGTSTSSVSGGAVLSPYNDIDLATTAFPEETLSLVQEEGLCVTTTELSHGTITLVDHADRCLYEITSLRLDIQTDGRHARVRFGGDWEADARRRDFTINALYMDDSGKVYDPVVGLADCQKQVIRFIGVPQRRLREDYLRLLRYFRFHALYGEGHIPSEIKNVLKAESAGLQKISVNRKTQELRRFLSGVNAPRLIPVMQEVGIWAYLFNDMQPTPAALDALNHIARRLSFACAPGTGARRSLGEGGSTGSVSGTHFFPLLHLLAAADISLENLPKLFSTLSLSKKEGIFLKTTLLSYQDMRMTLSPSFWQNQLYTYGRTCVHAALFLAIAKRAPENREMGNHIVALLAELGIPEFPLSGADFLREGLSPGPHIGYGLRCAETYWRAHAFSPGKDALLCYALAAIRETYGM